MSTNLANDWGPYLLSGGLPQLVMTLDLPSQGYCFSIRQTSSTVCKADLPNLRLIIIPLLSEQNHAPHWSQDEIQPLGLWGHVSVGSTSFPQIPQQWFINMNFSLTNRINHHGRSLINHFPFINYSIDHSWPNSWIVHQPLGSRTKQQIGRWTSQQFYCFVHLRGMWTAGGTAYWLTATWFGKSHSDSDRYEMCVLISLGFVVCQFDISHLDFIPSGKLTWFRQTLLFLAGTG